MGWEEGKRAAQPALNFVIRGINFDVLMSMSMMMLMMLMMLAGCGAVGMRDGRRYRLIHMMMMMMVQRLLQWGACMPLFRVVAIKSRERGRPTSR